MNGNAAIDLIMSRLGNRTDVALRATILNEMALMQESILEQLDFKPWFLLSEDSTAPTTVGEPRLPVPGNFLEEAEDTALWYSLSGTPAYMIRGDWDTLSQGFNDGEGNGPPEYYSLTGMYFHLFPAPDAVYTMHLRYYARDVAPLDAASTNLWLTYSPKLLIASTAQLVAMVHLQNPDLAQGMEGEVSAARQLLWKQTEARQHTNREYNKGAAE